MLDVLGQGEEEYAFNHLISELERGMELAARNLQFERAAAIRDRIKGLKEEFGV